MSEQPTNERSEELFARLVAGELEPSSPEVKEQLRDDPDFQKAVDDVDRLRESLGRSAAERRSIAGEARREITEEDRRAARAFLERQKRAPLPGSAAPGGPRWGARILGLVLGAAAVVALVVMIQPTEDPGRTGPLDGQSAAGAFPVGVARAVDHFQLPEELLLGGSAKILVYDNGDPADRPLILESRRLDSRRWDLTPEEQASIEGDILWIYEVWDGMGGRLPGGSFEARIEP